MLLIPRLTARMTLAAAVFAAATPALAQPATAPATRPAEAPPATQPVPAAEVEGFEGFSSRASYVLGRQIGQALATYDIDFDESALVRGVGDGERAHALAGDMPADPEAPPAVDPMAALTLEQLREVEREVNLYIQRKQFALQQEAMVQAAAAANAKAQAFLKTNAQREEVTQLASGLQVVILQPGEGQAPTLTDQATFHFTIGKPGERPVVNSRDQGQPAIFVVEQAPLPGLQEALLQLKPGGTGKFYLPADLAFGDIGAPQLGVGPGEVLEIEIDMIEVKPAVAPATQPTTQPTN